ncbi:hypothetical protein [Pseudomonas sp. NFACC37-1]|uniref:hypothetical protein n=1 Tax=Pseudomonas sp. NFACC37-1 TaxID=1566196 RepID=UPI0011133150|nr:hypothetical protein [Pseudomonas sp. NFACC37-1]
MEMLEVMKLLDAFIDGGNTSMEAANRLEVLIDDAFPDDDFLQEIVEILACYRPEGGDFLFDSSQVQNHLVEARIYLRRKISL